MTRTIFLVALALAAGGASAQAGSDQNFNARARALDGDTIAVDFRLLGVDAFEHRQLCERRGACWKCGKAAQDYAANLLRSKTAEIRLTPSTTYGRPVATVTVDGVDLGERLIRAGLAIPEAQFLRSDPRRAARYATAFTQAKAAKAGAHAGRWIEPSHTSPQRISPCRRSSSKAICPGSGYRRSPPWMRKDCRMSNSYSASDRLRGCATDADL